jgi:hypothetical protein
MPKFRGTIRHNDLEGGHFQLVAEDGTAYQVQGTDAALSEDGAQVEVEGTIDRGAMSFAMTGPILKVKSVRRI